MRKKEYIRVSKKIEKKTKHGMLTMPYYIMTCKRENNLAGDVKIRGI